MKGKLPGFVLVIGQAVMDWWDTWLDSTLITLIWAVAQITIVLGPPATFGVYYVVNNMFSGENLGVRGMIAGMKMYFGKAWIWGAINLFAILVIYTNVMFYRQWDSPFAPYLLTFISVLAGMWFFSTFYSLPFFMELQKPSVLLAIRNGWLLILAAPLYSLGLFVLIAVIWAVSLLLILPFFLGIPMITANLGGRAVQDRLVKYGIRKGDVDPREIR
jgi:hypothetical protein